MKSLLLLLTIFSISIVTAPPISTNDSLTVGLSHAETSHCDDPKGYTVEEGTEPGSNSAKIVRDGAVLHTIKLPTEAEVNGFAVNWVKKTKGGFEIAIEYGTRMYYAKRFNFICKQHKFYLSKIRVDSFDKQNPEKWSRKVISVRPNVSLEKFSVTDFMLEVFPRTKREGWKSQKT